MEDLVEIARLLDILGNRNRRRIIGLLRQKPCFVTEISETLMISPKAVIDHLQLMEREEILSCQMDNHRRKSLLPCKRHSRGCQPEKPAERNDRA